MYLNLAFLPYAYPLYCTVVKEGIERRGGIDNDVCTGYEELKMDEYSSLQTVWLYPATDSAYLLDATFYAQYIIRIQKL